MYYPERYISYAKRTYMVTRRKAAEAKRIVLLAVLPVIRIASEIMTNMQNHVINMHQKMEEKYSFLHASLSHCFF
jgi:hypothetical protein